MNNLSNLFRNGSKRNTILLTQLKYIPTNSTNIHTNLNRFVNSIYSEVSHGWVGIVNGQTRNILFDDFNTSEYNVIPFNVHTIDPVTLCRIGWDLGLASPGGVTSNNAHEPEMGFSVYLEDILENQPYGREELSTQIWSELLKTRSVIEITI